MEREFQYRMGAGTGRDIRRIPLGGNLELAAARSPRDADIIILSDADTVLLRDIDPLLTEFPLAEPAVRGHMAHFPPAVGDNCAAPAAASPAFWPWLFEAFDIPWPAAAYRYSMDIDGSLPAAPAYFNFGFVAMNAKALAACAAHVTEITRRVAAVTGNSFMRCQIALSIMAYRAAMDIGILPAAYNAANDLAHFKLNALSLEQIRVLHFLRTDEIDRAKLQPYLIDDLLSRSLSNPANVALQDLVRDYRATLT